MIAEIRHKTDANFQPLMCCLCEVCKREGPKVPLAGRNLETGEQAAETAAKAKGWVVHIQSVRTPVRKQATGSYCIQYFCPKHKKKAGTIEVLKPARKPREPRKERAA
jgi:hypothetical protein